MILLDAAGPILVLAFGIVALVPAFLIIVVVETGVLLAMRWAGFSSTLLDVLLMNLVSTLIGLIVLVWLTFLAANGDTGAGVLIAIVAATFVASVISEAGILLLRRRRTARETWPPAIAANVSSYLALGLAVYLAAGLGV
ncbi:MAG: hypothetical protein ABR509_01735 [Candidatus Limnocylindria bacterium]